INKTANVSTLDPPSAGTAPVTYTIQYANTGNAPAAMSYITDTIPAGFAFTTAGSSSGCNGPNGVVQISVSAGGSGYTSAPAVTLAGTGAGATATATVSGGAVTSVTITNPGTGYTGTPTITFGGPGSGASAAATTFSGVGCTNLGTLAAGATASVSLVFNV